jgi:hypothetical protein
MRRNAVAVQNVLTHFSGRKEVSAVIVNNQVCARITSSNPTRRTHSGSPTSITSVFVTYMLNFVNFCVTAE